jgi:sulfur carrier protein
MNVLINQQPHQLPDGATLAQAAEAIGARPPFATAVNLQFVPGSKLAQTPLQDGDKIEIIHPVTGG